MRTNKILTAIALGSALFGCGTKEKVNDTAPAKYARTPSMGDFPVFKNLPSATSGQITEAGAAMLKAGIALPSFEAEECLAAGNVDGAEKNICAFLWATGKSSQSLSVERFITQGAEADATLAIAISIRPNLVRNLSPASMLAILKILNRQPLWMRAKLANDWLREGGSLNPPERSAAIKELRLVEPLSPESIAQGLAVIAALDESEFNREAGRYCDPAYDKSLKLRCWRVIGALSMNQYSRHLIGKMAGLSPLRDSRANQLFENSFRELAKTLPNY